MAGPRLLQLLQTFIPCVMLMITLSPRGLSLQCNRIYMSQRQCNKEALKHLINMEKILHPHCKEQWKNFRFPKFLDKMTQVPKVILLEIVLESSKLLSSQLTKATNDKRVAEAISELQMVLHKISTDWSQCVMSSTFKVPKLKKKIRQIKKYFGRMEAYLKIKGYSRCALATVRNEMESAMMFVQRHTDILLKREKQ
nr:type I interferon 1 [Xenopus laevis]